MKHLLTLTIFSPFLGIILNTLLPKKYDEGGRVIAFASSLFTFFLTLILWQGFLPESGYNFIEHYAWIPALNINYSVGIDGLSLLLLALTSLLTTLAIAVYFNEITTKRRFFYSLILFCEVGLLGVFSALDIFLFYIFWEIMLIPMYFLIGVFGSGNRIYVAMKFLIFTLVGSLFMLIGIIYLYYLSGGTFDMTRLPLVADAIPLKYEIYLFLAFGLAFAIKTPIFPFHTWLPDAHTEAPTAGSILLAGLFLKAGTYGFYRIAFPCFPDAVDFFRPYLFILAVVGIIYGALLSLAQKDLKRLIAYSSVSHLGFVILGLVAMTPESVFGANLQMINHGISTGALFLIFGILYTRFHTRNIADYGGIARAYPALAWLFIFFGFASMGVPGLNNFAGEILILFGTFNVRPLYAAISALAVILTAVYILVAIQRVFFGKAVLPSGQKKIGPELFIALPLVALVLLLGVYPNFALSKMGTSVGNFIALAKRTVKEEPKQKLDVIIPEIYQRGIEIILPQQLRDNKDINIEPIPNQEEEQELKEDLKDEVRDENLDIKDTVRDEKENIYEETDTVIHPDEGMAPNESQDQYGGVSND